MTIFSVFDPKKRAARFNKLCQKHRKDSVQDLLNYQKEIEDKIKLSASFEAELKKKKNQIEDQFVLLKKSGKILKILP